MNLKVMVIDDSELVLSVVRSHLVAAGHDVVTRYIPVGAHAAVLRERPDVVLLDVNMPLLDGAEICASIREHGSMGATRVILHSDQPEAQLRALATACGADGYLCKTSDRDEFIRRFNQLRRQRISSQPATMAIDARSYVLAACGPSTLDRLRSELVCPIRVEYTDSGTEVLRRVFSRLAPEILLLGTSLEDLPWEVVRTQATNRDGRYLSRTVLIREHSETALPGGVLHWDSHTPVEELEAKLERMHSTG